MRHTLKICLLAFAMVIGGYSVVMAQQTAGVKVVAPKFKTVELEVANSGICPITYTYQDIVNSTASKALTKVRRSIYELTFGNYASPNAIDIRGAVEREAKAFRADFPKNSSEIIGSPYNRVTQQTSLLHNGKILCVTNISLCNLGGRDIYSERYYNFDLATGELISFDYLEDARWLPQLRKLIYYKLSEWSQNYVGTAEKIYIPTESIKITERGLRLYFNPGNVGSNADGVIEVELTDKELASLGVPLIWMK